MVSLEILICFQKCVSEHGVYMKKDTIEGVIIFCLYVDDLLITGSDEGCITKFKSGLIKDFEMTDLGLMTYFLGIEFYKSKKGLLKHQRSMRLRFWRNLKWSIVILPLLQLNQDYCCRRVSMIRMLIQLSIGGWLDPYVYCEIRYGFDV